MRVSKYSEQQIIGFLNRATAGEPVAELCRKEGFSQPTFYKWRAKFGGLQVSEAVRLRELEDDEENPQPRKGYETELSTPLVGDYTNFAGLEPSDVKKLKTLEAENAKLKKLLAEAMLDISALKGVFGVKR